jgi:thioredoxin 1
MNGNFNKLIGGEVPVLIDFYADWCQPCKTLSPILKEVKDDLGDKVKIVKIDVDKNEAIAQKHAIKSMPTLVMFQNGEETWRRSGVLPKEELVQEVESRI